MKKVLTVTMDGIRYHASRPADCRHCFFWKNRKKGCVLGKENCYYLIEPPKGPSKCEGCPYKRAKPCVLVPCYKDLMANEVMPSEPQAKRSSAPCSALHAPCDRRWRRFRPCPGQLQAVPVLSTRFQVPHLPVCPLPL